MKTIPLTQGKVALVDDEHYDALLAMGPWHVSKGYVVHSIGKADKLLMHREVLKLAGVDPGPRTDHRDNNRLNNQRYNLRPATAKTNGQNRGPNRNNLSGLKGVSRNGSGWMARIKFDDCQTYLGTFASPEEAARAYDRAARTHHGEFACCNFVTAA